MYVQIPIFYRYYRFKEHSLVPTVLRGNPYRARKSRIHSHAQAWKRDAKSPRPLLHPAMAQRYREEFTTLRTSLNHEKSRAEAHLHLRALIEKIILTPRSDHDGLSIDLYGDLAGILRIASKENATKAKLQIEKRPRRSAVNDNNPLHDPSVQLVAGAGYQHYLAY